MNDRLESWKQIASYLGRDVRTVTRWEKTRNLPVHRLPGGQAVFAYKKELDEWLTRGDHGSTIPTADAAAAPAPALILPPVTSPAAFVRTSRRKYFIGAGAILAIIVLFSLLLFQRRSASRSAGFPVRMEFSANAIRAVDDAGRVLWTHRFSQVIPPASLKQADALSALVHFADLHGDGSHEVLAAVPLQRSPNPQDIPVTEIDCFSNDGTLLWTYVPQEQFRFGNYDLNGPWIVEDIFVSPGPKPIVWAALGHYRWGNAFVVELDPETGKGTVRFVNTGTIYKLNETKIAGKPYLLIGGFNNEYAAGILAAVDEAKSYAISPQTPGTRHYCASCPQGPPDYYFVFPRSEINRLHNAWEDSVRFIRVDGTNIEIEKAELGDAALGAEADTDKVHAVYDFHTEPTIEPYAFRFDSYYDMLHRDLQSKGKLDHGIESCPERLQPQPVRAWMPLSGWKEIDFKPMRAVD